MIIDKAKFGGNIIPLPCRNWWKVFPASAGICRIICIDNPELRLVHLHVELGLVN